MKMLLVCLHQSCHFVLLSVRCHSLSCNGAARIGWNTDLSLSSLLYGLISSQYPMKCVIFTPHVAWIPQLLLVSPWRIPPFSGGRTYLSNLSYDCGTSFGCCSVCAFSVIQLRMCMCARIHAFGMAVFVTPTRCIALQL